MFPITSLLFLTSWSPCQQAVERRKKECTHHQSCGLLEEGFPVSMTYHGLLKDLLMTTSDIRLVLAMQRKYKISISYYNSAFSVYVCK
jgi:hypothetical protein